MTGSMSSEMVAAARARGIQAEQASAESLPYPDGTFDAVFSNAALHWVRDQDAMMAQVHRVLKPGGRFVAEMGGHGNIAAIRVAFGGACASWLCGLGRRELLSDSGAYRIASRSTDSRWSAFFLPAPYAARRKRHEGWLRTFFAARSSTARHLRELPSTRQRRFWPPHCGTKQGTGLPTMCDCASSPRSDRAKGLKADYFSRT